MKYYPKEAIDTYPPESTVYRYLYDSNKDFLKDIALIFYGKKITYEKMFAEADRVAASFTKYAIKENDNVVFLMPAVPELIYSILGLNKIGANVILLNPTFSEEQLLNLIIESEAKLLLTINELFGKVEGIISDTQIETIVSFSAVNSLGPMVRVLQGTKRAKRTVTWKQFYDSGENVAVKEADYQANRSVIMVFSSGSTGASKGIQLSNGGINANICDSQFIVFDKKRQDIWFDPIPIWFSTSIISSVIYPLLYGISVILEPIYDFKIFEKHIHKYHPNFVITAVGLANHLYTHKSKDWKYFKYFVIGGEYIAPVADEMYSKAMIESGAIQGLHKGYGMCELSGANAASGYMQNVRGSAGYPIPHVMIAAFDPDTNEELKYGERGEIRVCSPSRMKGYYKRPEATAEFFFTDKNGNVWAKTGDMGYMDEDGNLFISGRMSDSYINDADETIYLFDVERAILDVADVRQCKAVVSVVNGVKTHVCHFSLYEDKDITEVLSNVDAYLKGKLKENHIPHLYKFYSDALPVSLSGKLDVLKMQKDVENLIEV